MDINTIRNILKSDSSAVLIAEIQKIIDLELEKPPEEINTKLIDECLDLMEKYGSKNILGEDELNI